jgi:paraquat-inducible protein B
MWIRASSLALLIALLGACSERERDLHVDLAGAKGLRAGSPVLLDGREVGRVDSITTDAQGGEVAKLAIRPEFRAQFNRDTRFVVARDPANPEARRVEAKPAGGADTPPLAEGARVEVERLPEALFPLGEMLRSVTEGLGMVRDQVERFRTELQRLPQSPEAQRLRDEWVRLQEELKKAQAVTEESVKKELIPRIQKDMAALEKSARELEARPSAKP